MIQPKAFVPFIHVASVARAVAFYRKLGFNVRNELTPSPGGDVVWAYLESGAAQLMLAQAQEPVVPGQQAVMFYLYLDDVQGTHRQMLEHGVDAGTITYPSYCPGGEFRVTDVDGYTIMITHT